MTTFKLHFGDEHMKFTNCKIRYPKEVPVTEGFDSRKVLGMAKLYEENGVIFADVELQDLKHPYSVGSAGIIVNRDGDLITEFDLQSVSIISFK
jgi:hypothetical protein